MKFVLVNGRTPSPESFCAVCCGPIGERYLREIGTRLSYCSPKCYGDHCKHSVTSPKELWTDIVMSLIA